MINRNAKVSDGVMVWFEAQSNIGACEIGMGCIIHSHVWIGDGVIIGKRCKVQAFSFIPTGVTIESDVFIGPRVTFTNDKHPPSNGKGWEKTLVCAGAVIGAGAIILPGITIGAKAIVGAGAVVTKDVPSGATVVGNPAKPVRVLAGV